MVRTSPCGGRILDYQTVASDREVAVANLERALAGERVTANAFSGDGLDRRSFEVVHSPLMSSAGVVDGVVVRAREVTAARRAEEGSSGDNAGSSPGWSKARATPSM